VFTKNKEEHHNVSSLFLVENFEVSKSAKLYLTKENKNMKRFMVIGTVLALMALVLAACPQPGTGGATTPTTAAETATTAPTTVMSGTTETPMMTGTTTMSGTAETGTPEATGTAMMSGTAETGTPEATGTVMMTGTAEMTGTATVTK
jgi:hypothetical protein